MTPKLGAAFAALTLFILASSASVPAAGAAARKSAPSAPKGNYVLEFRARSSHLIGHSLVVVHRAEPRGRLREIRRSGFLPALQSNPLAYLADIKGTVGTNRRDYSTAPNERFLVRVGERQYRAAMARMDVLKSRWRTYNALDRNCNSYLASVAQSAGIKAPSHVFDFPRFYVARMRAMNR